MQSHHRLCTFQPISPAAAYNAINVRNQHSRLVFVDLRLHAKVPFPTALLPPLGLPDFTNDFDVIISCLRADLSRADSARCSVVLFIDERRLAAVENEMAARLSDSCQPHIRCLAVEWKKLCCFDIDQLFQYVPSEFIGAALSANPAPRVPSLIDCLLPRKLFLCERKLVFQALHPTSGLGISRVVNVTMNAAVHRPDITHNFPIEDSIESDIAAGGWMHALLFTTARTYTLAVCTLTRPLLTELLDNGESVLVHCLAGVSRSGSVVIDLVMHALSLDFHAAKALVQKCRPEVKPNAGFERQLDVHARWGVAAMDMLTQCIAQLTFQVERVQRAQLCSTESSSSSSS